MLLSRDDSPASSSRSPVVAVLSRYYNQLGAHQPSWVTSQSLHQTETIGSPGDHL